MTKLGIAVVGVGRWGVHLVRNFLEHPNARVVAVVDSHSERLDALQKQFNLDASVILATDWQAVRNNAEIEAVAIATPASTHYSLIADALHQSFHVLAEKPLTLNPSECVKLCRLAEQQQRQLMVDHTYLFHPAVQRGQEIVESGRLGELRYGYAARTHLGPVRQDVDALWDLAIHDIGIFNTWLGQVPIQVQATGQVWLKRISSQLSSANGNLRKARTTDNGRRANPQELADLVQVILTYPSGFQAFIHLCWLNPDKQRRLAVVGSQGTLIFDELAGAPLTFQQGYLEQEGEYFTPAGQQCEVLDIGIGEPLKQVCDRFLTSIQLNQPSPLSSGWIGAQLVQVLSCLEQSLQQRGTPITVPPLSL